MLKNQAIKSAITRDWAVVKKFCSGSHRQALVPGRGFINETPPEEFYNLPLFLAYAVLDEVLSEFLDQGTFVIPKKKKPLLGDKMIASRPHLPWQNYDLVEAGKNARNDLAHEAKLLERSKCFSFIGAIESELKAWNIL